MNALEFSAGNAIPVLFHDNTSSYHAQIQFKNTTDKRIYFYVATTFGPYADIRRKQNPNIPPIRIIEPFQQWVLLFKIKSTNQISAKKETIIISYGFQDILSVFIPCQLGNKKAFGLQFSTDFVQDQLITSILRADAEVLCEEAMASFRKNNYKQAMHTFEEAFQLYRPSNQSLLGMAECQIHLGMYAQALISIQTGLLIQYNPKLQMMKVQVLLNLLQKGAISLINTLRQCKNTLERIVGYNKNETYKFDKNTQLKVDELTKRISQLLKYSKQKIIDQYIRKLHQRALDDYDKLIQAKSNNPIEAQFDMKEEMQQIIQPKSQDLKQVLGQFKSKKELDMLLSSLLSDQMQGNTLQTPEEVLDPITYEIMKDPYIVPYGNSYDRNYLTSYFKFHGNKDPISRKQLRPEWIRPNNTLARYIKQHPDYGKWVIYQINASTIH